MDCTERYSSFASRPLARERRISAFRQNDQLATASGLSVKLKEQGTAVKAACPRSRARRSCPRALGRRVRRRAWRRRRVLGERRQVGVLVGDQSSIVSTEMHPTRGAAFACELDGGQTNQTFFGTCVGDTGADRLCLVLVGSCSRKVRLSQGPVNHYTPDFA